MRAYVGNSHDLLSPIAGLASIGFEAYGGARGAEVDAGARALFRVPYLSMGMGADYNLRDRALDLLVTAHSPVRRGGIILPGGQLRVDWYPLRGHSFTVGWYTPLGEPLAGRGQPIREYVVVGAEFQPAVPYRVSEPTLSVVLDSLHASAEWIRRLVVPFLDQDGRDAGIALARAQRYIGELQAHLALRSVEQEVRHFHSTLERAFSLAAGDSTAGRELARGARGILLEAVILPYNSLLGRKKKKDTLEELATVARGRFSRLVVSSGVTPEARTEPVLFVFQRLTALLDEVRGKAAKEWDDPRVVWLPLQYALLPEQYDEQSELDALLEQATEVRFSDHNRIQYVANLQFHWELLRTIRETKDYHVLWIHDFPAVAADGSLDWASFTQVVDGYLRTLAERVEAYDRTGTLPTYFIFLDQHYYEQRKSRLLMNVLEDPLRATPELPRSAPGDPERLALAQQRLRDAVSGSRVLRAEARQYGEAWLQNRIKVHVSITNRPDPSFWSGGLVGSVFAYPDQVMRDHRKLAFHDVTEADPSSGLAVLTGMGVGQHYLGPSWDDRSLLVQGPLLLELKRAARDLLVSQGIAEPDLPLLFRRDPFPGEKAMRVVEPGAADGFDAHAVALVNGTGYLPKPLNVGKALFYSLLGSGAIFKIPDSLWNSTFYAGLLVGACLRGATVSIIAPARDNGPSSGSPQMARAHELFTRLVLVRRELGGAIGAAGGQLRTGLYALEVDRHGFASRAETWSRRVAASPSLRSLIPSSSRLLPVVAEAGTPARGAESPGPGQAGATEPPKLHQKVQFWATKEFWDAIATSPEWPLFMSTYLRYREATYSIEAEYADARRFTEDLERIAKRIFAPARGTARAAGYAIAGSQNQDYRGMFMDGEVGVLFSGAESLVPLVDLLFLEGTVTWVDDQETLDRLLPPVSELMRRLARVIKDAV
ncbi:MAG: hypothetical protein HYV20_06945 [Gemmatimonadetes bacterium]|nr:hypothetical protein [Gemmatimonadota bacterium]